MDFPSNSQNLVNKPTQPKKKKPEKNVEKIVSGDVIKRPVSVGKKFKGLFFGGEFRSASSYIVFEVLLPALKNMAVDATTKGIERVIYGEAAPRRSGYESHNSRISYNGISNRTFGRDPRERAAMLPDQPPYHRRGSGLALPEIALTSRGECEKVVAGLTEILDIYEAASVADYYDMLGLPSTSTDNDWGWTRLSFAEVRQTRYGFVIDLPDPTPLS